MEEAEGAVAAALKSVEHINIPTMAEIEEWEARTESRGEVLTNGIVGEKSDG